MTKNNDQIILGVVLLANANCFAAEFADMKTCLLLYITWSVLGIVCLYKD